MNPFSLEGKTILITGASSGIGRQCSISASQQGAKIILLARNTEKLEETNCQTISPNDNRIVSLDLSDPKAIESTIAELKKMDVTLDGLVHSAGISATLPLTFSTPEKVKQLMDVNVYGGYELIRLLVKNGLFSNKGASIVLISSVMGSVGESAKSMYAMSKGAIHGMVKSLSIELAKKNIRVNAIAPGVVETPLSAGSFYSQDPELFEKVKAKHPLGIGSVEDVANGCVFLLSAASRWITGTVLFIDGGYTAQ
ncbi:MAG TPA: SDR family oxidoreductase [Salinivirgaceae bacterium]|nr:SDR family oxidoreductase [Salinivirgaceae bacterium]